MFGERQSLPWHSQNKTPGARYTMTNNNYIGNGTTVGKFILITFAGWILGLAAAKGLNLGIDAQTLAEVIGAILGFVYSYLDAKYPNSFKWLDNAINSVAIDEEDLVLNEEYEV